MNEGFFARWKSRTVILTFGALFVIIGKWTTFPHDEASASLMGLAAVITACGGLHILNKRYGEEGLVSVKRGDMEYVRDTRRVSDVTNIVEAGDE